MIIYDSVMLSRLKSLTQSNVNILDYDECTADRPSDRQEEGKLGKYTDDSWRGIVFFSINSTASHERKVKLK